MVEVGSRARRNIVALTSFYETEGRPKAASNLARAVIRAADRIGRDPHAGLRAPRPYPNLAEAGVRWLKEGRYWFAYSTADEPVILAVFHDQADIPGRV